MKEFRKKFEIPILRGQDAAATPKERAIAIKCLEELSSIVNKCLIRRTSALLTKYLPVKFEMVICVKLAPLQKQLYKNFISCEAIRRQVQGIISNINKNVSFWIKK